jgi:predicted outer membrane repeat protein
VESNTAGNGGGGFYVDTDSNVILLNTTVAGNTAGDAGGIGADTRSQLQVESSLIEGNTAGAVGGGFSVGRDCALGLVESTVTNNLAGTHGGKEKPRPNFDAHRLFYFIFTAVFG